MTGPDDPGGLAALLSSAGCLAADEEASELLEFVAGNLGLLEELVQRRIAGEPLAWITGAAIFCGERIQMHPGVYVPRWQSEPLARLAAERLADGGTAIDLCTGSGAIARTLMTRRPGARVVGADLDPRAVTCAASNGVEAFCGDLFAPLPARLAGRVDVVVGVLPYVPTPALRLLPRDTLVFESPLSYDGGTDGTAILRRGIADSVRFVRPGGSLLLELGGDQAEAITGFLVDHGYGDITVLADADGDARGIAASRPGS